MYHVAMTIDHVCDEAITLQGQLQKEPRKGDELYMVIDHALRTLEVTEVREVINRNILLVNAYSLTTNLEQVHDALYAVGWTQHE